MNYEDNRDAIKSKKKEPDFLCHWDFCDTCINYRREHNLPMPVLYPHPEAIKEETR